MPSKLIENKHFATIRYDRQNREKQHVLTVTGLTGWDFKSQPENSSYENVFKVALALEVPHKDVQQLFKSMVFNVIFRNVDDHLNNQSFIYNKESNSWNLAPAYDLTYALNPLITFKTTSRALSINGKRTEITLKHLLAIAEEFAIKNPKGIIDDVQKLTSRWVEIAGDLEIPSTILHKIHNDLITLWAMKEERNDTIMYTSTDGKASLALFERYSGVWLNKKQLVEFFTPLFRIGVCISIAS